MGHFVNSYLLHITLYVYNRQTWVHKDRHRQVVAWNRWKFQACTQPRSTMFAQKFSLLLYICYRHGTTQQHCNLMERAKSGPSSARWRLCTTAQGYVYLCLQVCTITLHKSGRVPHQNVVLLAPCWEAQVQCTQTIIKIYIKDYETVWQFFIY